MSICPIIGYIVKVKEMKMKESASTVFKKPFFMPRSTDAATMATAMISSAIFIKRSFHQTGILEMLPTPKTKTLSPETQA